MALSATTRKQIAQATMAFAHEVARIAERHAGARIVEQLQGALDKLKGGRKPQRLKKIATRRPRSRRRKPADYDKLVPKLTALIKKNGGTLAPVVVSKEFGLTPEQRRMLVGKAVEKGVVKVTGERRKTRYGLARARGRKRTKAKRK